MSKKTDGGPAFPGEQGHTPSGTWNQTFEPGLTLRQWYATFAPEPTEAQVRDGIENDKITNPHNDDYKPPRRSIREIVAGLRFAYADAMLAHEAAEEQNR